MRRVHPLVRGRASLRVHALRKLLSRRGGNGGGIRSGDHDSRPASRAGSRRVQSDLYPPPSRRCGLPSREAEPGLHLLRPQAGVQGVRGPAPSMPYLALLAQRRAFPGAMERGGGGVSGNECGSRSRFGRDHAHQRERRHPRRPPASDASGADTQMSERRCGASEVLAALFGWLGLAAESRELGCEALIPAARQTR